MLLGAVRRTPEAVALVDGETGEAWTYARLGEAVSEVARSFMLARKGVVVWLSRIAPEGIAAYLAGFASGNAVMPLAADLHESLLERFIEAYQAEFVVGSRDNPIPASLAKSYESCDLDVGVSRPLRLWSRRADAVGGVHEDLALLLPTSGSTGSPKMVRLSRRNVESNSLGIVAALRIDAG
jgi:acyl-CoA synthetase (AMP-forming)/AMP-acid ligase II